jgi:DNA-binding GntR family transcriptional regulator
MSNVTEQANGGRKLTTGPTLSDQAYRALREEITTGQLKPGQRVTERALAQHLGVSPTPVREALQRLEQERLIERDAVRAIRVAEPSVTKLYELTLIEVALRGVAARLAAERATDHEVARIVEACDRAEALADGDTWTESRIRDVLVITRGFHQMINEAAHNQTLLDMISTATAFDWAFRLRWSADSHPDVASVHHSLQQHRAVANAIQARDGKAAEEAMRRHSASRADAYLAIVAREPEPAARESEPAAGPSEPAAGPSEPAAGPSEPAR